MRARRAALAAIAALAWTVAATPALAQATSSPETGLRDEALDQQTREVATQLRCPVCQGMSVEDSPTELAQQMRALVREQLEAGRSPEEVKAYFVGKYGEWILLKPKAHGFNLLVYLLPWLALAAGLAVIVFALKRWTGRPDEDAALDDDETATTTTTAATRG